MKGVTEGGNMKPPRVYALWRLFAFASNLFSSGSQKGGEMSGIRKVILCHRLASSIVYIVPQSLYALSHLCDGLVLVGTSGSWGDPSNWSPYGVTWRT